MSHNSEMIERLKAIENIMDKFYLPHSRPLPQLTVESTFNSWKRSFSSLDCDEVYDNIILGNGKVARNPAYLNDLKITHILNCAHNNRFDGISTDQEFYEGNNIRFKGLNINDSLTENISRHFDDASEFIHDALNSNGKIYVHCYAGVSRSATLVLAYLMIKRGFSIQDAFRQICKNRNIYPNQAFIKQLLQLDMKLNK